MPCDGPKFPICNLHAPANYGLRIHSLSPQIKAFQVYAPVDQNFVAFEPQFSLSSATAIRTRASGMPTTGLTTTPTMLTPEWSRSSQASPWSTK